MIQQGPDPRVGQDGWEAGETGHRRAIARLRKLLASGKSQAECARLLGVSTRTVGRVVAEMKKGQPQRGHM
jgi:hypothetical protein